MADFFRVLITGCSLSANHDQSGWRQENFHNHYSKILSKNINWTIVNRAIGGCSNREISLRTVENCLLETYDFCIVQWSSLHRYWFYESENNVDNETQILPRVCGWGNQELATIVSKILVSNYLNDYMALKQWLLDQIFLQTFLEHKKITYIFIRGFPNYVHDLEQLNEQKPFESVPKIKIPTNIKRILNFDDNPDDYILEKLLSLTTAYGEIDKSKCIGYNVNDAIYGMADKNYENDYADDGAHPGMLRNALLANHIIAHCKSKGIGF